MEARQNLDILTDNLSNFSLGANVTLVNSQVAMDKSAGGEYESWVENARVGEIINDTRPMQGQSPYIINASLNYIPLEENSWTGNISYNVQGPSLFIVGVGQNPDVYQAPFHSLNMKVSKTFNGNLNVGFRVQNILGADQLKVYKSYESVDQIFEKLVPARTFSLSLSYKFAN